MSSNGFYTELAPFYRKYSEQRKNYLQGVDNIIISSINGKTMLDIGSADGIRAERISKKAGVEFLVLTEPNKKMFELSKRVKANQKINISAENLNINYQFDAITCLWNVLGHVKTKELRIKSLKNMNKYLNKNGKIFLDVNNKYNVRAYGITNFLKNLTKDIFSPNEINGDLSFNININQKEIPAMGHVFNFTEISNLIQESGLKIIKNYFIDYKTGEQRKNQLQGQLLFELGK